MRMPTSPWQMRAMRPRLLLLVLLACAGCSGSSGLSSASGKVTYQGKGIKGALVFFHPKDGDIQAQRPTGVTREDGSFTLTTGTKEGAPVGQYTVTITWPEEQTAPKFKPGSTEPDEKPATDRLGGRYADPKTSTLQATIKSGSNTLPPFDLK
jgi:hypothetical protein